jgi:hypothetical protein
VAPAAPAIVPAGFTPFELPEVVAGETFLSLLTRSLWGRVAVLAVSGLLGLAGVLAAVSLVANRRATDPKPDNQNSPTGPADPVPVEAAAKPAQFDRRWLPEQTQLLIDLRLSRLAKQPPALRSLEYLGDWWQGASRALLTDLNLGNEQVRRMTWAATDAARCAASCVVVIELEDGSDANQLLPTGGNIDLGQNRVAHRPPSGYWPHPLLAVDAHTIVTGSEEVLRRLVDRDGDVELASRPLELLLKKLAPGGDLAVLVDLSPRQTEVWKVPNNLLDVWPAGKSSWHALCDTPRALGLSVPSADQRRCELGLVCDDETKAGTVRAEIEKLAPLAIRALPAHIAALKDVLPPKRFPGEAADQYKRLLDDLLVALPTARCDAADGIVWFRCDWGGRGLLASAAAALDSKSALKADWLAAARAVDENMHRGLLGSLLSYLKAQTPPRFPEGRAGGAPMLEPQTRLSWIAEILPYLGHPDWRVEPGFDWNDSHNQPVTKRPLPEVVNPVFGPALSSGYPATHYVGVAGVGQDAAQLPADDPRAGVFGYGRQTRQQDLLRGGSHTIAVLGVQGQQCGPWAQGGPATVRPLTQPPYCNGPDGFGSGQADGMVAGFADGSVRFLSKDIDPHVMEQLATVRGGDQVDMAAIEPKPPEADVKPPVVPPGVGTVKPPVAVNVPPAEVKPPVALDPKLQAKLNMPIAGLAFAKKSLADAVQLVSAMSALPVSFDPDAMQELGVSLNDLVSIEVVDTTAAKTLKAIAAKRNMTPVVENGQVLLTSPAEHRERLQTLSVAVSDLTGGSPQAAADLAARLQRLVAPESWQAAGGRGTVVASPEALQIAQTARVHYQIVVFCEKLRVARGLKGPDPKKFALTTRTALAKAVLNQVVSMNVTAPASLASVLERFEQSAGCRILIDRPALAASGISEDNVGKFKADKLPLGEALGKLLEPLGLAWRAVDAGTLQVTTQKAVAARMELEFYPVGRRPGVAAAPAGQPPTALIEQIKAQFPGAAWGAGGGVIDYDPPSQCLLVLQSQPLQRAIEAWLAEKR